MSIERLRKIAGWLAGIVLALPLAAFAQPIEENAIKTAFVYNFIVFTDWPGNAPRADEFIELCVNSGSPMAQPLAAIDGKLIKSARLKVRQLDSLMQAPSSCRILYLDELDRRNWPYIQKKFTKTSILTISDDEEIKSNGAMIGLFVLNNRIAFDIDVQAAGRSGLSMSSKLLRLARTVK